MVKEITGLLEIVFGTFLTLFGGIFLIKFIISFNLTLLNILSIIIFAIFLIIGLLLLGDALRK